MGNFNLDVKPMLLGVMLCIAWGHPAGASEPITIVGSSTVFPFSTAVAERFGRGGKFFSPIIEATGTGGGMKLFCSGVGDNHPDITNASRRIKPSEYKACSERGIEMTEVKIGFDGIVLGNDKSAADLALTREQIFRALAQRIVRDGKLIDNPYERWNEIDPSLPDQKIEILGPPPTSGTRDAFVELAMEGGAKAIPELQELRALKAGDPRLTELAKALGIPQSAYSAGNVSGKKLFKAISHAIREDGAFIEAGENDNLIVQKLLANPEAVGIFGFSFLDQNMDKIKGASIDGIAPTFEDIARGDYTVSRSLYFYVKNNHQDVTPGIREFVAAFTSEDAWGDDGYLTDKGLIPLNEEEREMVGMAARQLSPLSEEALAAE